MLANERSLSSDSVDRKYVFMSFKRLKERTAVAEDIAIVPQIVYTTAKLGYALFKSLFLIARCISCTDFGLFLSNISLSLNNLLNCLHSDNQLHIYIPFVS